MKEISKKLFWIGHASFYLKSGGYTIYIDPFRVSDKIAKTEKADLILVTHAHFDHFSKEDIEKISKEGTKIIASTQTLEASDNVQIATPGFKSSFHGIEIEAVPAYNIKSERLSFHPKSNRWVGYVLEAEGERIYHAGDTDAIPEMKSLEGIDYALLPIGGTYTMDVQEAIEAAGYINPKHVIPMHYKNLLGEEGSKKAEQMLKAGLDNVLDLKEVQKPTYSFQ
ncbi:MAG: MBL fold metallo-hydrolase [Candidatus Micrarchaeia archaeon]